VPPSADGMRPYWAIIIADKPPLVRTECYLKSEEVGRLAVGTKVYVLREEALIDMRRAFIQLEGEDEPYGWMTSATKDGTQNLEALGKADGKAEAAAAVAAPAAAASASAAPIGESPAPSDAAGGGSSTVAAPPAATDEPAVSAAEGGGAATTVEYSHVSRAENIAEEDAIRARAGQARPPEPGLCDALYRCFATLPTPPAGQP